MMTSMQLTIVTILTYYIYTPDRIIIMLATIIIIVQLYILVASCQPILIAFGNITYKS